MRSLMMRVVAFVVLLGSAAMSAAAPGDLLATYYDPSPAAGKGFGISLAPVGNSVWVGAHPEIPDSGFPGAVYKFIADGTYAGIAIPDPAAKAGDTFGQPVRAVDDNIFIGATYDDTDAANAGIGYLFNGSTGAQLASFRNPRGAGGSGDRFGNAAAALGSNVVIGAYLDDTDGSNAGIAYKFDAAGNRLLTYHSPAGAGAMFGLSLATTGNKVVVGAPSEGTGGANAWAAYVMDGTAGTSLHTLKHPTPTSGDGFGGAVAATPSIIAVGANQRGNGGRGYVDLFYAATGAYWKTISDPAGANGDEFGWSVATVGDDIVIGAPHPISGAGAVYLYDVSAETLLKMPNPNPNAHDLFGYDVAGMGNNILVGAFLDDNRGYSNNGVAYLIQGVPEPSTFVLLGVGALGLLGYAWRRKQASM